MTMFPFKYTILMWSIHTRRLMYYSFVGKEISQKKFRPIITSYYFYCCLKLCLTKVTKFSKILTTSDFCFKRKIHVYLEWSSTIVKKYLWPWIDGIEYSPHISTRIKSKHFLDLDVLRRKGSLFYFAKWQTSQTKLYLTKENLFLITSIDLFETCPNRKCQRFSRSLVVKLTTLVICRGLTCLIWRFW